MEISSIYPLEATILSLINYLWAKNKSLARILVRWLWQIFLKQKKILLPASRSPARNNHISRSYWLSSTKRKKCSKAQRCVLSKHKEMWKSFKACHQSSCKAQTMAASGMACWSWSWFREADKINNGKSQKLTKKNTKTNPCKKNSPKPRPVSQKSSWRSATNSIKF